MKGIRYYRLDPEVPGFGLSGEVNGIPSMEIDIPPHDHLLAEDCQFFVSELLYKRLSSLDPTGVVFIASPTVISEQRREFSPNLSLQQYFWMRITGVAGEVDIGIYDFTELVVSESVLEACRSTGLRNCRVNLFTP